MNAQQIRAKYLAFMEKQGHAIVPSSSLVPDNDPTTLFTGSGMQPMLPYLLGQKHPKGTRVADSQKCFRAEDIDEVGDNRHTTFFEMLGNWSFGDYFKEEQIQWMYTFLTQELQLNPARLYITVHGGDTGSNLPKDEQSPKLWQELFAQDGIEASVAHVGSEQEGYERGMKEGERIFYYDSKKNWWSRAGVPSNMPVGEPGGPDSEMFYDFGTIHDPKWGEHCHPNCDCGRFMEIGNNVFMQYIKAADGSFVELEHKNIGFGGGLERLAAAVHNDADVFKVPELWAIIQTLQELSGKTYEGNEVAFRIIADHIRGAVFMITDGVLPKNTEQGYFVRRLLRRSIRYADSLAVQEGSFAAIAEAVIAQYQDHYTELTRAKKSIIEAIGAEEVQFRKTLQRGMRELEKHTNKATIDADTAFTLFTTYGFPLELTVEVAKENGNTVDTIGFAEKMNAHKETSRSGAAEKFKGGLADHSETVVQYHTATHLLLAGLRTFLGKDVHQAGSNITKDRLRFDFTHPEKVDPETLQKVEDFVNDAITKGGEVSITTMSKEEAHQDPTVEGSFWERYPDTVTIYTITAPDGTVYSKELCGGPHVESLSQLPGTFKIIKEESSSAGVRRIKAVLVSK